MKTGFAAYSLDVISISLTSDSEVKLKIDESINIFITVQV